MKPWVINRVIPFVVALACIATTTLFFVSDYPQVVGVFALPLLCATQAFTLEYAFEGRPAERALRTAWHVGILVACVAGVAVLLSLLVPNWISLVVT